MCYPDKTSCARDIVADLDNNDYRVRYLDKNHGFIPNILATR